MINTSKQQKHKTEISVRIKHMNIHYPAFWRETPAPEQSSVRGKERERERESTFFPPEITSTS